MPPPSAAVTPSTLTGRGAATRQRILDSAADLIYEHGVSGTSLDDVRRATATSKSQIYHYFTDKAGLVRAVVDHQAGQVLAAQASVLAGFDSAAGLWRWRDHVVATVERYGTEGGCPLGRLSAELANTDEGARRALALAFTLWQRQLTEGLVRMQAHGQLRPGADVEALSSSLLAAFEGGLLLAQALRDVRLLEAALDSAIEAATAHRPV